MRDPRYGRMCFKSIKTLGTLHSKVWNRPRPSTAACSTPKNVEFRGLYPIHQSGAIELLIMRDPHCGRMYFKSVKTVGVLYS